MLRVLGLHRAAAADIDEELVPAELLGAAQQSWDEACELGDELGVRNSQASVLAPDRHHRPDDGLRHHRHRARPRALQDEEAGRRRHDDDRQPDDPACAAPPRLRRRPDRRDRRLHRRAQDDPRRTAPGRRAHPGVRLLDGRQRHPLLGSRADDGGGPAVHLRGHLQDREHARGRHGRRGRAAPHRRLAARREGDRHLPGQLQGRPAARHGQEGGQGGPGGDRRRGRRAGGPGGRADRRADRREAVEVKVPVRKKLPRTRTSSTFEFRVADCKGFVTVGEYDDGRPGEIFLKVAKQGSTLAGVMDAFVDLDQLRPPVRRAAAGLRRGVHQHPLRAGRHDRRPRHAHRLVAARLHLPPPGRRLPVDQRAARAGHPDRLRAHAADAARRRGDGDRDPAGQRRAAATPSRSRRPPSWRRRWPPTMPADEAPSQPSLLERAGVTDAAATTSTPPQVQPEVRHADAPYCMQCGVQMQRAGSCHACPSCGSTSGCS